MEHIHVDFNINYIIYGSRVNRHGLIENTGILVYPWYKFTNTCHIIFQHSSYNYRSSQYMFTCGKYTFKKSILGGLSSGAFMNINHKRHCTEVSISQYSINPLYLCYDTHTYLVISQDITALLSVHVLWGIFPVFCVYTPTSIGRDDPGRLW